MSDRRIQWRCFHCGDAFTKAQERWAREHFGADQGALPVCQMRLPGEHHLLTILRKQEDELQRHRAEDTDLWRSLYAQDTDHAAALRSEEERGYGKGVADCRAEITSLRALIATKDEALRPFVRAYDIQPPGKENWPDNLGAREWLPGLWPDAGDFRRALTALQTGDKG